ncbi:hypothetical protein LC613_01070 [Nostoc sphaeroides CHAB 2801]|uniref:hypothetical protein n=1 Tax=Nostoc sphaeroides TaxID=446679 RepID=UPI000E54B858|nr:hypothetical protein [Nostoc sphaeroides]MCC5626855.1 hypothetical protein [Nostoc sphaeroides CHAB 2801]
MSSYCSSSTKKAVVTLNPSKKQIIVTENLPITITCGQRNQLPTGEGNFSVTFTMFYNPLYRNPTFYTVTDDAVKGEIRGFRIIKNFIYGNTYSFAIECLCRGTSDYSLREYGWYPLRFATGSAVKDYVLGFSIDNITKTGSTLNKNNVIRIVDSQGTLIHEEENECDYQVACDERCPEGFCECPSSTYPGYCCLDCAFAAASIRAITNELRGKNG